MKKKQSAPEKIIFLDVDGVLNSDKTKFRTTFSYSKFVDEEYILRLKQIIDETNAKVVLSSDWRLDDEDRKNPSYNGDLKELEAKLSGFGISIFDYTPNCGRTRGDEIQKYLNQHPKVKSFVILDDRVDMQPNLNHLVQTDEHVGLTNEDVVKAVGILNK